MSARRPYIYQDREWLEISRIREKIDVQGDEIPLSEFDQPYLYNNPDDDHYPTYEWDYKDLPWPGPGPFPDPVPIPGPCNQEGGCNFVTIANVPESVECEEEYHFQSLHVVYGCEPATFEDAFLVWTIDAGEILGPTGEPGGPEGTGVGVGMRWKATGVVDGQTVTVCVQSIDGSCSDCRSFKITCAVCCEEFEIVGPDTVNPDSVWGGTITPPCPGATCTVTNNSGCPMECSVNPDGTSVTVPVGVKNCGSFNVTVTEDTSTPQKQEDNCPGESASKGVRINGNGGFWKPCWFQGSIFCNGPFCSCTWEEGERRWSVAVGAGIFCGPDTRTVNCFEDWPLTTGNIIFTMTVDVKDCDQNGPCAGSSRWGESLAYWANPDCECI